MFSNVLNADQLKKNEKEKQDNKKKIVNEMADKQQLMKPFVIFIGVKDNPIPYEKKYRLKNNVKLHIKEQEFDKMAKINEISSTKSRQTS